MSEQQHTPEPWLQIEHTDCQFSIMRSQRGGVFTCIEGDHAGDKIIGITETDYRRAMACVNACAGLPTEALEGQTVISALNDRFNDIGLRCAERDRAIEQRDELLAALKVAESFVSELSAKAKFEGYTLNVIRAAIAKVEGKA